MVLSDVIFSTSIAQAYDHCMVPLKFEPYARDLARRVAELQPERILETAAGTGIVTGLMARALPGAHIIATDLNRAMLDVAAERLASTNVIFLAADAQSLPFADASFDAVVCQFGVMFFPDRVGAYREAWRVLRPGGHFLFNAWDRIEHNPVSYIVSSTVASLFPADPPSFYDRVPFGYHDKAQIEADLAAAGFDQFIIETISAEGHISSAADAARGLCLGSPIRSEIEERAAGRLDEVITKVAEALDRASYGSGAVSPLLARVMTAVR